MRQYDFASMIKLDEPSELDESLASLIEEAKTDPQAMITLANVYFYGYQSYPPQYDKAFLYYQKAANLNVPFGYFGMGVCFYEGKGTSRDNQLAFECFSQASDEGVIEARLFLGYLYEGKLIEADDADALALYYYKDAANHHNEQGCYHVGYCYEFGRCGLEIDYQMAVFWYKQAAELNFGPALVALGQLYAKGLGVDVDLDQSIAYRKRAVEQGNEVAMFDLAMLLIYGPDDYTDKDEGLSLLHEASELNFQAASVELARLYFEGVHVMQDNDFALKLLQIKAQSDQFEVLLYLAWLYVKGLYFDVDFELALSYLKQAYRIDRIKASYYLGEYYRIYAPIKDDVMAYQYYQEAIESNDGRAYVRLGDYHRLGIVTRQDDKVAFSLYQHAADLQNLEGMYRLGQSYAQGRGTNQDLDLAFSLYQHAAFSGNIEACLSLVKFIEQYDQYELNNDDVLDLLIFVLRRTSELKDITDALNILEMYVDFDTYDTTVRQLASHEQKDYESVLLYQHAIKTLIQIDTASSNHDHAILYLHELNHTLAKELLSTMSIRNLNLSIESFKLLSFHHNREASRQLFYFYKKQKELKKVVYYMIKWLIKKPKKIF